jgi:hypothetical protein
LPDCERGGPPGGGGIGRPDEDVGAPAPGGRGGAPSGRGPRAAGSIGGRAGRRSAGAEGAAEADAAATPGGGPAGAAGRGGAPEPLELTMRRGAAGGGGGAVAGRVSAAIGCTVGGGAAGAGGAAGVVTATGATGMSTTAGAGASAGGGAAGGAGAWAAGAGAAAAAAAAFLPPFFSTGGSSGCTSRTRPSRSALRRTRSACASTMLEEWLLTPIPSALQRSSVSLFVSPSSLASSYTRMFAGKSCPQPFIVGSRGHTPPGAWRLCVPWTPTCLSSHDPGGSDEVSPGQPGRATVRTARGHQSGATVCRPNDRIVRSQSAVSGTDGNGAVARNARPSREAAAPRHSNPAPTHAPRPSEAPPMPTVPSARRVTRTRSAAGPAIRQPTQVRTGAATRRLRPLGPPPRRPVPRRRRLRSWRRRRHRRSWRRRPRSTARPTSWSRRRPSRPARPWLRR